MAKLAESYKQLVIDGANIKEESTYDGLDAEDAAFSRGAQSSASAVYWILAS